MRRYLAPVIIAGFVGTAGVTTAIAADLSKGGDAGSNYYSAYGARIEPIVIYDDQPGVIGRSYWYSPWANRHYFPKTGKRPKGRAPRTHNRASACQGGKLFPALDGLVRIPFGITSEPGEPIRHRTSTADAIT